MFVRQLVVLSVIVVTSCATTMGLCCRHQFSSKREEIVEVAPLLCATMITEAKHVSLVRIRRMGLSRF